MYLKLNLLDIQYLEIEFDNSESTKSYKLELQEKNETNFIATMPDDKDFFIHTPHSILLTLVCAESLFQTKAVIENFYKENGQIVLIIKNPEAMDFEHNREYYRAFKEFDCIYTVETENGIEAFNAVTYDISIGGVTIVTAENIIPKRETSIVICTPNKDFKAHVEFSRCDAFGDNYKLAFIFIDLSDEDIMFLNDITKQ